MTCLKSVFTMTKRLDKLMRDVWKSGELEDKRLREALVAFKKEMVLTPNKTWNVKKNSQEKR